MAGYPVMSARAGRNKGRFIPALILGYGAWWVLDRSGPVVTGSEINAVSALAAFLLATCGFVAAADVFGFIADLMDWAKARTPRGDKGKARWARSLRELGKDIATKGWAPYWGVFRGSAIFADFISNALTLGPAGVGKGIRVVLVTILSIRHSKTVVDFKGELACVLARALRKRGEIVRILNIGDMWTDILGPSDRYNPVHLIADDFERPGGIQDVTDDIDEMCLQLLPEPDGGGGKDDNKYFRDGSRTFLGFAIQTCVLIQGREATLGHVAQLLNDRRSLQQHALWACGRLAQKDSVA